MGIFDIMLHVRRLMMFVLAVLIGFLFQYIPSHTLKMNCLL